MKPTFTLGMEFVAAIPDKLEERMLYVSMDYATVVHKCCCGCGLEVVTPLSPTDWKLTYDGAAVSLYPSIGNWGFPCRSHYWIDKGTVVWAEDWTQEQVNAGRSHDQKKKAQYFDKVDTTEVLNKNLWNRLKNWLFGTQ